jgi:hypothetical protein
MIRNVLLTAIVSLIICAGVTAEANSAVYVGKSDATGFTCYILTDTITYQKEGKLVISTATLEMREGSGNGNLPTHYLDYTFYFYPGYADEPRFENSQGYSGIADPYNTPIEWAMFEVIRDRY